MNGVLLVDKDPGMTSHDVVARARRLLGLKSIGHAGTLDPMASGLLLLLVGEATKISDYLLTGDKGYEVTVRLGLTTDSMDITGETRKQTVVGSEFDSEKVRAAVMAASGTLQLAVPMHSAVKVGGKKLYESAHRGEIPPQIPIRPMTFYAIEWLGMTRETDSDGSGVVEFSVRLRCSKGSFIRAWANHVGDTLGCGGTVAALRRVMSAPYEIDHAMTLDQLQANLGGSRTAAAQPGGEAPAPAPTLAESLNGAWVPLAEALPHFGRVEIAGFDANLLRNGQLSKGLQAELLRSIQLGEALRPMRVIHREERRLMALLLAEPGEFYKIKRVFTS